MGGGEDVDRSLQPALGAYCATERRRRRPQPVLTAAATDHASKIICLGPRTHFTNM